MFFRQIADEKLAQYAYLIGCQATKEAVVIDPERDIDTYIKLAEKEGLEIVAVADTHIHADYISGMREFAERGVKVYASDEGDADWKYEWLMGSSYDYQLLTDGDTFKVGNIEFRAVHSPGHTPEHLSYLVTDLGGGADRPMGIASGDFVFVGDLGRPDLLESAAGIQGVMEPSARLLYKSVQRFLDLDDYLQVWPAHGAGSACGKNLSTDLWSTIGDQKATNYALRAPDKATFVELVTEGQPPAPGYFVYDAMLNRQDRELLDETEMPTAMSYDEARAAVAGGAMLVDGRNPEEFALGHLRDAINVGLNGRYAEFAGSIVPSDVDIVLFTDPGSELEGKNRLGRIGFDRVVGFVDRPYDVLREHPDDVQIASRLTASAFADRLTDVDDVQVVDVRNPGEVADGTIGDAAEIPVGQLPNRLDELDVTKPTVVYCAGGYRSSVAASLLRANGFVDVSDILGGYGAWTETVQEA